MKTVAAFVLIGQAALAQADAWWEGAPECAHDCFNSWWSSATDWPAPTSYCSASQGASVSSCISSACSATPTAVSSYNSLSASLCTSWSACSAVGSTRVYTTSAPAYTGRRPDFDFDDWNDHDDDDDRDPFDKWDDDVDDDDDWEADDRDDVERVRARWTQYSLTWTGGVYTVTGCEWDGNVWAGGPWGYGEGGAAGSPWGPWGSGWRFTTVTQTVTRLVTVTGANGASALTTSVGPGLVALASSGDITSTSVIGATDATPTNTDASGAPTGTDGDSGTNTPGSDAGATAGSGDKDAAPALARDGALAVKVVGAVLGSIIAGAALL